MPTRNINLTEHLDRFVEKQVGAGRFRNASEVLRAGLHLLEQRTREDKEKLALLRALAAEGARQLDQGQGIVIENDRQLEEFIAELGRRADERVQRSARGG